MKKNGIQMPILLCVALISSIMFGCGPKLIISKGNSSKSHQSVGNAVSTTEEHNSGKTENKEAGSTLTLMNQYLEVPDGNGKYYHRLAVTDGDNDLVKRIIESSMKDLERQAAANNGRSYAAVCRNDDKLLSYECSYDAYTDVGYRHTFYTKTINVADGRELELSDIIKNMDMLPEAMYEETYQVRGDHDAFIDFVNLLIEDDVLHWSVSNNGINLYLDPLYTAGMIATGGNAVMSYGYDIFLSYEEYPDILNGKYFEESNSKITMTRIFNSVVSLTEEQLEKLSTDWQNDEFYWLNNVLWFAQELKLILYSDQKRDSFYQLRLYDYKNELGYTEKIYDGDAQVIPISLYLAELNGKEHLVYSMAYYDANKTESEREYYSETFVFRIDDKKILLKDRVNGLINPGGGEMSPQGFYMNSYEDLYINGLAETEWNSLPMYTLTDQGKIVQKETRYEE